MEKLVIGNKEADCSSTNVTNKEHCEEKVAKNVTIKSHNGIPKTARAEVEEEID